jgi:hypothetical protein
MDDWTLHMAKVKTLHFSIRIDAPVERVWETMLASDSYRTWTSEFTEGSYYEGSWDPGATIRFLAPSGDGMFATIAENRPHEYLSIKHLGFIVGGVEDCESESIRAWAPAYENYSFKRVGGETELLIHQDVTEDFERYMLETWPKALARLKALCERPSPQEPSPCA